MGDNGQAIRLGRAAESMILVLRGSRISLCGRRLRCLRLLGWSMAPTYRGPSFSYNWYTDTYVSYCTLLESWEAASGHEITADMFERALFDGLPSQP